MAYPVHPSSSPTAGRRKTRSIPSAASTDTRGAGTDVPIARIAPYDSAIAAGTIATATTYHVARSRRTSSVRRSSALTPAPPRSRKVRIAAASTGQKDWSALTGSPGSSRAPVAAPIHQSGTESASTSSTNAAGARRRDAASGSSSTRPPAQRSRGASSRSPWLGGCDTTRNRASSGPSFRASCATPGGTSSPEPAVTACTVPSTSRCSVPAST